MTGKKALLSVAIPVAGVVLRWFFAWGHVLGVVGTVAVVAGFPLSIHWSFAAMRDARRRDRPFAVTALVLSLGGAILVAGWVVMGWTSTQLPAGPG